MYKKMTTGQRAEYDFRFSGKSPIIEIEGLAYPLMFVLLSTSLLFATSLIAVTNEKMEQYKPYVLDLLLNGSYLVSVFSYYFLAYCIYAIGLMIYRFVKEWKWLKQNGIA